MLGASSIREMKVGEAPGLNMGIVKELTWEELARAADGVINST